VSAPTTTGPAKRPGLRLPRLDRDRLVLALAAPLLAIVTAVVITSVVMSITGQDPFHAYQVMLDFGSKSDSQVWIINRAIPYYLAAAAVAIGFRMNLFNIGVDGQYRVAAFFAAAVGGSLSLPGPLATVVIIVTAMACGALWSGIAGYLKATRGVNEVITTIMLNARPARVSDVLRVRHAGAAHPRHGAAGRGGGPGLLVRTRPHPLRLRPAGGGPLRAGR
jgi:ABC-type uncharacterized transport system permease subunit